MPGKYWYEGQNSLSISKKFVIHNKCKNKMGKNLTIIITKYLILTQY